MVIYVKFNEDDKAAEFTTALEAKQHLADNAASLTKGEGNEAVNSVFVAVVKEPVDLEAEDLDFSEFDSIDGAKEFVDSEVERLSTEDSEAEDSDDESEDSDDAEEADESDSHRDEGNQAA